MSEPRMSLSRHPDGHRAVQALEQHVRSRIDADLLHLVKLRASFLNGCAFCADLHSVEAMKDGEDARRLFAVAVWRESPFFDAPERAALALTDAVTRLGDHGVPDDVWDPAVEHFGLTTAGELVFAIATINVWNRLAVTGRTQPPSL